MSEEKVDSGTNATLKMKIEKLQQDYVDKHKLMELSLYQIGKIDAYSDVLLLLEKLVKPPTPSDGDDCPTCGNDGRYRWGVNIDLDCPNCDKCIPIIKNLDKKQGGSGDWHDLPAGPLRKLYKEADQKICPISDEDCQNQHSKNNDCIGCMRKAQKKMEET